MIIAYHAAFTTYGTWLPNDPRGSFSRAMYNEELAMLGEIRYGRRQHSRRDHLRRFWTASAPKLSRPPYFIDSRTRPVVGVGFGATVARLGLTVRACAIMNDHVHVLVVRSKHKIEYVVGQLKGAATHVLGLKRTPWARGCWKVFINDLDALYAAARYIEQNPIVARMSRQCWDFVTPLPPRDV